MMQEDMNVHQMHSSSSSFAYSSTASPYNNHPSITVCFYFILFLYNPRYNKVATTTLLDFVVMNESECYYVADGIE